MNIVHVCLTPLAGHPIQIVNAINSYTSHKSRFININPLAYGTRTYEEDLVWPKDKEEVLEHISSADLIHLHQTIDLSNNPTGLDLSKYTKKNVKYIRQFASEPSHFLKNGTIHPSDFLGENALHLVVGQYHERYYPEAIPIPSILNPKLFSIDTSLPTDSPPLIVYSPSNKSSQTTARWASKGYPQTIKILEKLKNELNFNYDVIMDMPHKDLINIKRRASIIIDEMVTGSYHLSGLEGLALGKPTFSYLDQKTASTLAILTGSNIIPFLSCRLHTFPIILKEILESQDLIRSIGSYSREWMLKNYHPSEIIKKYIDVYELAMNGAVVANEPQHSTIGQKFLSCKQFDLITELENQLPNL